MKKGISQLIASVLLLAVSVSVAGVYTKWAPNLAEQATKEAKNQSETQIKCRNAGVYIKDAEYDITGNLAEVTVENTGTISLYNDLTIVTINSSEITGNKTISELEVEEEQLVEFESSKIPETVLVASKECPQLKSSTDSINVTK